MNNIYVDGKLHEDCVSCSHLYFNSADTYSCGLLREVIGANFSDCIGYKHKDCPLKPLSDRLAEERKKVCDELRRKAEDKYFEIGEDGEIPCGWVISEEKLQQIERGE